jgi:hypothetical protein
MPRPGWARELAPSRELDGVREEVPHDLLEPIGVPEHRPGGGVEAGRKTEALRVEGGVHRVDRRADDRGEVDGARLHPETSGHDARDVEEVLDHPGLGAGVALDDLQRVIAPRLVEAAAPEELDPAHDGVQRRAELVGERGHELVLAPGRGLRVPPGRPLTLEGDGQLLLDPAPGGDVAEHEHGPGQGARPRPDGRCAVVDRDRAPVPGQQHRVVCETGDPALPEDARHRALDGEPGALVDDAEHGVERAIARLGLRPSGEALGNRVHRADPPGLVGGDHGVSDAGERRPEPRLGARGDGGDGLGSRPRGPLALAPSRGHVEERHGDPDQEQRHAEPRHVQPAHRPGLAVLLGGAHRIEPVLVRPHVRGQLPDLVHQILAAVGRDHVRRGVETSVGAGADGLVELGDLPVDRGLELPEPRLVRRVPLDETA